MICIATPDINWNMVQHLMIFGGGFVCAVAMRWIYMFIDLVRCGMVRRI